MPVELDPSAPDLAQFIRPGDGVVIGQCCGEPVPLVDAAIEQAGRLGPLRVFLGGTFRDTFAAPVEGLTVWSYGGLGRTGRISGLTAISCHFSAIPRLFAADALPGDVALLQVAPPGANGRCSLGVTVDYLADALSHARVLIAEVNDRCPATSGTSVGWDELDAVIHTSRPLVEAPAPAPGPVEERIAAHVAELVEDGDTLQLGVGSLPEAIMRALKDHRGLRVHSGMVSDGILDLVEAGAVEGDALSGAALGSQRLFDALDGGAPFSFRPVSHTHSPATLAGVGRLCAINSALEVDLAGQAGSESANGRLLGAVGGQVDFLRGAAASGGNGVLALPAERIVEELSGPISTAAADVDWVVTENGARRLRGLPPTRRRELLDGIR